jgi:hypothetical protein
MALTVRTGNELSQASQCSNFKKRPKQLMNADFKILLLATLFRLFLTSLSVYAYLIRCCWTPNDRLAG